MDAPLLVTSGNARVANTSGCVTFTQVVTEEMIETILTFAANDMLCGGKLLIQINAVSVDASGGRYGRIVLQTIPTSMRVTCGGNALQTATA